MTIPLIILASACVISGFLQPSFANLMSQMFPKIADLSIMNIEVLPLSISLLALVVGGLPAYMVYVKRSVSPEALTRGSLSRGVYKLLVNGYYFDSFYNYVFVKGTAYISNKLRKLQTGILNVNMLAFLIGFLFLLGLLFSALQGGI